DGREGSAGAAGAGRPGLAKTIAVATAKRMPEFPDLPTVAETLPGFSASGWQVMVAPNGTPEPILPQGEPGHGNRGRGRHREAEARHPRQLLARHDGRRGARLRARAAGNVAARDG